MTEEWRDIKGFEGYYQVSNLGRVKSLDRHVFAGIGANHKLQHIHGKILSQSHDHKNYKRVILCIDGGIKLRLVHRLVAEAFIPNPNNYPIINHKDKNPSNNCMDNLEWCTYKYNNEYDGRIEKCRHKISQTLKGRKSTNVLTDEQRKHISEGAKRGWETRRKNMSIKSAIVEQTEVTTDE